MTLTTGQAGDDKALLRLVDGYFGAEATAEGVGDVRLLADKAYSHLWTRTALRKRGIKHTIGEREDQVTRRKAKGSAGGRPQYFDGEIYKQRNTVERGFTSRRPTSPSRTVVPPDDYQAVHRRPGTTAVSADVPPAREYDGSTRLKRCPLMKSPVRTMQQRSRRKRRWSGTAC